MFRPEPFPEDVRTEMSRISAGRCQCSKECVLPITEFDHMMPNTKTNNKLYPLFIQSPFNCKPINGHCHKEKGSKEITYLEAEYYEKYLQQQLVMRKKEII